MLTGIAHLEMRVRDLAACRTLYGKQLGLEELAHGAGPHGDRVSMFAIGDSVLELHEDADAVTSLLPFGEKKDPMEVPGSVGHFAFYTEDNNEAFRALKDFLASNSHNVTWDGPSVQPIDHAYMQRSLLEFSDPGGYVIQIADLIDPREHLKDHLDEKRAVACGSGLLRGIDHVSIICSNVSTERDLFGQKLGFAELSHRTETVPPVEGFEESVFAAGMTDLEIAMSESTRGRPLGSGAISSLGFWTDDVVRAYRELVQRGMAVGGPPSDITPLPGMPRRAFTLEGLDGLRLEIAQKI